jgi:hypothetical protein
MWAKSLRWIVVVAAFGAIVLLLPNLPASKAGGRSYTTDITPVEIYIQDGKGVGTRLRIPAAYMQWEEDREGGPNFSVGLIAIYPEMTPYALVSQKERKAYLAGIREDPLRYDPLIIIQAANPGFIEREFAGYTDPTRVLSVTDEPDFVHYTVRRAGIREYFVPHGVEISGPGNGKKGPFFQCLPDPVGVPEGEYRIRCEANVQLNDRLYFQYYIPKQHLKEWPSVEERVNALVQSFVVDCFEGEVLQEGMVPAAFHPCAP